MAGSVYHTLLTLALLCPPHVPAEIDPISNDPDSPNSTSCDPRASTSCIIDPLLQRDSETGDDAANRTKKELSPDRDTRRVKMLFEIDNGVFEDPMNLTTTDYIIRLQEKYEYKLCEVYVKSVPDIHNNYFQFDEEIVTPLEGDSVRVKTLQERINSSFDNRYRMYKEPCDPDNEKQFWYEMFLIAENDTFLQRKETLPQLNKRLVYPPGQPTLPPATTAPTSSMSPVPTTPTRTTTPTPPINPDDYYHLQFNPSRVMRSWNEVWKKYRTKEVCNQKLLLECLPDEWLDKAQGYLPVQGGQNVCLCRRNAIGLPTIVEMREFDPVGGGRPSIPSNYYTTQDYYDDIAFINNKEIWNYTSYRHRLRCAVRSNLPNSGRDLEITNPCDFFLPMIGMCMANCVENSSCATAHEKEKFDVKERAITDVKERVIKKLHETYHNRCECHKGKRCRKLRDGDGDVAAGLGPCSLLVVACSAIIICLSLLRS